MIIEISTAYVIPLAIGTIFAAGGTVYMAKEAKKKADNAMPKDDCECYRQDLAEEVKELRNDVKDQTKVLYELVGEMRRINGHEKG